MSASSQKSNKTLDAQARSRFKALLLAKPNYFTEDLPIATNTAYEELTCLGYQPELQRLEGVVSVFQDSGYDGGLCSTGSQEYVRFYLSYDGGTTWEDQGVSGFTVYDSFAPKPLDFSIAQNVEPNESFCFFPNLPLARAILSWNYAPPANSPNWLPVWGNVVQVAIQIAPSEFFELGTLFSTAQVKLPESFSSIDLKQTLKSATPSHLNTVELSKLYEKSNVPPHRYLFAELDSIIEHPTALLASNDYPITISSAVSKFLETSGDTTYEELNCVGLDENRDTLAGILRIKLNSGYSGSLCTAGSQEYVAFWVDWGDGAGWTYVGTASVNVHDVAPLPAGGLDYAVVLPVDVASHIQPCSSGPKTAAVRAILSWQTPPPPNDPDYIPVWGNQEDVCVLLRPGVPLSAENPVLGIIGGVGVPYIDTVFTGMTVPNALFALYGTPADEWVASRQCPFGGLITIQGAPYLGYNYRVSVQKVGTSTWIPLEDSIYTTDQYGVGTWRSPSGGFFSYLDPTQNIDNLLAYWESAGDYQWYVKLDVANTANVVLWTSPLYLIQLDNTAPTPTPTLVPPTIAIHIDSGGDCKTFSVPFCIQGHFTAQDLHFGAYTLTTLPSGLPGVQNPTPSFGTTQTVAYPGDVWTLNTAGMTPCGYVVQLDAWDNAIVGSEPGSHNWNTSAVGFSLIT
jgi:DNA uptake protein ComE-like DNA-binding protein